MMPLSRSFSRHRVDMRALLGALFMLFLLVACNDNQPAKVTPTPTSPLDIVSYNLNLPADLLNAPVVGALPDNTALHVIFTFRANQQLLNQLGAQKQKPGQNQDVESIANKLGITDATYQKLKTFFGLQSISLTLNSTHTSLTTDGKASSYARLFQTHFVLHQLKGRQVFAPASNPRMPRFMADALISITGMDNYTRPPQKHASFSPRTSTAISSSRKGTAANCQYDSNSSVLATNIGSVLYGYNAFWKAGFDGKGMTINLLEFDTYDVPDLQNYFACVNFHGTFKSIEVNNARPQNVDGETLLDIEMIASLAPGANILDFEMDQSAARSNDPMLDVLQAIINTYSKNANSASVLSISWGGVESNYTSQVVAAIDQDFAILSKAEHMTIFVAAGDCAAFDDQVFGDLSVDYPGSDPNVVDVGGTMPGSGKTNGVPNEAVWADGSNRSQCQNSWGGGGGNSTLFNRPSWQSFTGVANKYSRGKRQVPDVVAFAFPIAVFEGGQWGVSGGTSAAAPIWASGMALLNEATIHNLHLYFATTPLFYVVAQREAALKLHPYRDIVQGNNLYFPATTGWDFASGLGAPSLVDFYRVLVALSKS